MSDMNERHAWIYSRRQALRGLLAGTAAVITARGARGETCATTQSVPIEGPYFLGEPELREKTGTGLVLTGRVLDAVTCAPIAGAQIVRWHANVFGVYEDYFRAQMRTDADGRYRLESIVPGAYAGLQRHIHFVVKAPGYGALTTQWQIADALTPGPTVNFDFTLRSTT